MPLERPSHLAASPPTVKHTWDVGDDVVAMGRETPALIKNAGEMADLKFEGVPYRYPPA